MLKLFCLLFMWGQEEGGERCSVGIIKYLLINWFLLFPFSVEQRSEHIPQAGSWSIPSMMICFTDSFQLILIRSKFFVCEGDCVHEIHTRKFSQVSTLSCFPALDIHLGSSCFTAARAIKPHNSEMMANKVELFGHPHIHTSTDLFLY